MGARHFLLPPNSSKRRRHSRERARFVGKMHPGAVKRAANRVMEQQRIEGIAVKTSRPSVCVASSRARSPCQRGLASSEAAELHSDTALRAESGAHAAHPLVVAACSATRRDHPSSSSISSISSSSSSTSSNSSSSISVLLLLLATYGAQCLAAELVEERKPIVNASSPGHPLSSSISISSAADNARPGIP
ncbi:unnamed protein product [Lampetra fluviatilis]